MTTVRRIFFRKFQYILTIFLTGFIIYGILFTTEESLIVKFVNFQSRNFTLPRFEYESPAGIYCVLPNVFGVAKNFTQDNVTLVTHGSSGYLKFLLANSQIWNGPISTAVYVNKTRLDEILNFIRFLRKCYPTFDEKVEVHIFYEEKQNLCFDNFEWFSVDFHDCANGGKSNFWQVAKRSPWYPVNVARNLARKLSRTKLILIADIELMPSENLAEKFLDFYKNRKSGNFSREVFVIPVFETKPNVKLIIPENKAHLVELIINGDLAPFHSDRLAYECHKIPGLSRWLNLRHSSSEIQIFKSTSWVQPCWEPVFVSDTEVPFHNERFVGYGKNKIQQLYKMCFKNYTFHILDNAFLVHADVTGLTSDEWRSIADEVSFNNIVFDKFVRRLKIKYANQTSLC